MNACNKMIIFLMVGVSLILTTAVTSRAQMSLSPTILDLKSYPGGLQTFFVGVTNTGNTALQCTVAASAMEVRGGGLPVSVETSSRSCNEWMTLEPSEFTLTPGSGKRIMGRLRAPKDTSGGYYALISITGAPQGEAGNQGEGGARAAVRLQHRVQAVVLMTVPGSKVRAIVEPGQPFVEIHEKNSGYILNVPVRNRGNLHDRIKGFVDIRSEAGQVVEQFELAAGRGFIMPEMERVFSSKGTVNLPDGIYTAGIRLDRTSGGPMRTNFPFAIMNGKPDMAEITDELRRQLIGQSTGFLIVPAQMSMALNGGERRMKPVELRNLTKKPLKIQAHLMDWKKNELGFDLVLHEKQGSGRSAQEWLSLRSNEFELRPMGRMRVPLMIQLPRDAEGEGYAAVTFSRPDAQLDDSPRGLAQRSVLVQVGAKGTAKPAAEIEKMVVKKMANGTHNLAAGVKNTGNTGFVPEIGFKLIDQFNNNLGQKKPSVQPSLIQAGGNGLVEVNWPEVLPPGEYTMEVVVRFDPNIPPTIKREKVNIGGKPAGPETGGNG